MEFKHELVLPNEDLPFKLFVFEGKNGHYIREKHWHRSIEIFAVLEGSMRFFVNECEYPLKAGEFMLINSNEVHSVAALKPNLTIVLQIPLNTFENYYVDENYIRFSHHPDKRDEKIMKLIQEMYQTYNAKKVGYELQVKSDFYAMLYLLVNRYRAVSVSAQEIRQNKKLNRLTSITGYIQENYQKDLSLESLANIFGYTPTYLSHMFQKYAQMTYKSYLQNVRVEHAYRELAETDHAIGDIAVRHGFPNSKAFANEFRRKYKMLPSEYRRSQISKDES